MVDINHDQYKMLKRISKAQSIETGSLTDEEKKICDFLYENKFVLRQSDCDYEESNLSYAPFVLRTNSERYVITQNGKAEIFRFETDIFKIKTSFILSVISIILAAISTIVSIIALLKP